MCLLAQPALWNALEVVVPSGWNALFVLIPSGPAQPALWNAVNIFIPLGWNASVVVIPSGWLKHKEPGSFCSLSNFDNSRISLTT